MIKTTTLTINNMRKIILFWSLIIISAPLFPEVLTVTNTNDSGLGSLRRIIEISNDGDSIIFDKFLAGKTIELQSTIEIENSISIEGKNAQEITLIGKDKITLFLIKKSGAKLYNLSFSNGKEVISFSGKELSFYISKCTFKNNNKVLYPRSSVFSLTILDCTFKDNQEEVLYSSTPGNASERYSNSIVNISNCIFENNEKEVIYSETYGSAYYSLVVDKSTFRDNKESCILLSSSSNSNISSLKVTDCIFENNRAKQGAAICIPDRGTYSVQPLIIISNSIFENNNSMSENGGAIYVSSSTPFLSAPSLNITNSIFTNNQSKKNGGAFFCNRYIATIRESVFDNNKSVNNGGAIDSDRLTILNCKLENNNAKNNGGAINSIGNNSTSYSISVRNCTFSNNSANKSGGAMYIKDGYIVNNTFNNNQSIMDGGALFSSTSTLPSLVQNCSFGYNSGLNGGAIYGLSDIVGNVFSNNKILPDDILNDVKNGISKGYNIYTSNQNTVFSESTDFRYTGSEPLLIPIGDYGGNTPTMPINTTISDWESIIRRLPIDEDSRETDQRGYSLSSTKLRCAGSVEIQEGEHFTGINKTISNPISIYPNPTSDIVYFTLTESKIIRLYDSLGKLLIEKNYNSGDNSLDLRGYSKGVYFLSIGQNTSKILRK